MVSPSAMMMSMMLVMVMVSFHRSTLRKKKETF
jgi:hypothetical protein